MLGRLNAEIGILQQSLHSSYVVTIAIRIYVFGYPTILVGHGEYLCLSLHKIGNKVICQEFRPTG